MGKIDIHNYEEFVLDYLENNLSPEDRDAFIMFINEHPEIKEEIELVEELEFATESVIFESKGQLKKTSPIKELEVFDYLSIASIEGDLSQKENLEFIQSLDQNENEKRNYELYRLTKLDADNSLEYPGKSSLKKTGRKLYYTISAAASVLILIALYLFIPKSLDKSKLELADLDRASIILENKSIINEVKVKTPLASVKTTHKREKDIKINETDKKSDQSKVKIEEEIIQNDLIKRDIATIKKINPVELSIKSNYMNYNELALVDYNFDLKYNQDDYLNMKSYLTKSFNKRVLENDKKEIEWFDIAQASVKGINRIFGGNMKLERIYNEKGEHEKTEFTSSLLAVSTPAKK